MTDFTSSITDKRARDCMTRTFTAIGPDESVCKAAEIMLDLSVSGLPVLDAQGRPLGVVSEADFRLSDAAQRCKRREAWLKMLSGGQEMAKNYLDTMECNCETVRRIMASPAICVEEETPIEQAAALMSERRIKRLLVLRDGLVVGIVTRADLLRLFAPRAHVAKPVTPEFFEAAIAEAKQDKARLPRTATASATAPTAVMVTAAALKQLVIEFENSKSRAREDAHRASKQKRDEQVKLLLNSRFTEAEVSHLMALARDVARRGGTAATALVFPSALCSDGGRAINLPDPDWPATLRGKAADFFLRWDKDLRPQGFALSARIVSFPDGFPGDAELALVWGR